MGNRFGRNQKRRMREELAAVRKSEELHIKATALMGPRILQLESDIRSYQEIVSLTEKVLGSYFASLPEKKLQVDRKKGADIIGWLLMWPSEPWQRGRPEAMSAGRCIESTVRAIKMIEMALLEGAAWAEEATNIIHVRYYFADGQSAYSVSRQALRHLPKDHLETTVVKECADLLISELSKRGHR